MRFINSDLCSKCVGLYLVKYIWWLIVLIIYKLVRLNSVFVMNCVNINCGEGIVCIISGYSSRLAAGIMRLGDAGRWPGAGTWPAPACRIGLSGQASLDEWAPASTGHPPDPIQLCIMISCWSILGPAGPLLLDWPLPHPLPHHVAQYYTSAIMLLRALLFVIPTNHVSQAFYLHTASTRSCLGPTVLPQYYSTRECVQH